MAISQPLDLYDVARFFSRVAVKKERECWTYNKYLSPKGYGMIKIGDKKWYAHRLSYTFFNGPIPENLVVRHKCDNRCCVNPYHLETGTPTDNVMDRNIRGRTARGSKNGRAKLSEEQVIAIFKDKRPCIVISQDFPVCPDMVSRIKRGVAWGHVTGATPPRNL
jgi:hypothetical protein